MIGRSKAGRDDPMVRGWFIDPVGLIGHGLLANTRMGPINHVNVGNRATKKRRPLLKLLCGDFSVPLEKNTKLCREGAIYKCGTPEVDAKNRTHTS